MNLPSIDPFFVPEINLDQKTVNGEFSMLLKNLNIHGLSKYQIKDLKWVHIDDFTFSYIQNSYRNIYYNDRVQNAKKK